MRKIKDQMQQEMGLNDKIATGFPGAIFYINYTLTYDLYNLETTKDNQVAYNIRAKFFHLSNRKFLRDINNILKSQISKKSHERTKKKLTRPN